MSIEAIEKVKALTLLGVMSAFAFLFYANPPETLIPFPLCYFNAFTGWLCPGCGLTRATAALLHAEFSKAFFLNPFVYAAQVWTLYAVLGYVMPRLSRYRLPVLHVSNAVVITLALVLIAFGVLRNTPIYPFVLFGIP
jgi:hypothetical protein